MAALKVLLVLLWLGVTTCTNVDLQKRVIGGRPCRQDERRYHVLLVAEDSNSRGFCGGSLLRNGWILTAAHCWESGQTIDAYLGLHRDIVAPIRISRKPEIYQDSQQHDLMLLKLPDTATIPRDVTTIELPDCLHQPNIGDTVQIAGQGSTFGSNFTTRQPGFSQVLQCGNINKVDCSQLKLLTKSKYSYQYAFCGQTPEVDLCLGDSGGGVEYKGRIYGVNVLVGEHPCRTPARFMDLCHQDYLSWIEKTIGAPPNPGYVV